MCYFVFLLFLFDLPFRPVHITSACDLFEATGRESDKVLNMGTDNTTSLPAASSP